MTRRAKLLSLSTAVPDHILHQDQVADAAAGLFAIEGDILPEHRLRRLFENTAITKRHSCVPLDWYLEPHGFGARNDLYLENALQLLCEAAESALAGAGLTAADIDTLVTVSSTGVATPSLDARLMQLLPFRQDAARLPIFGLGCNGGVLGLARSAQMALSAPGTKTLLLVVELCGLTFRHGDRSKSNLVAAALFGDGAAGAVLSTEGEGPYIRDWAEKTWPDTLDIMGWEVGNDGLSVTFSRDIPNHVHRYFAPVLRDYLRDKGMNLTDLDGFLPHPGGAKVLDAMAAAFNLPPCALDHSRTILREYGNMSAATVLFVLKRAFEDRGGKSGRYLLTSLGPGFTSAFAAVDGR
jgi:alkylresorcinol/alkylpyrone synthase